MAELEVFDKEFEDPKSDKKQLYEKILNKFQSDGEKCAELCWRLVRLCLAIADSYEKVKNKNEAKKYVEKSFEHAKKAIELNKDLMNCHKWYCAAVGRMAPLVGTKERIQFGHQFKEHRDIAVNIDPNDMLMHHMYGRWCLEVAGLSFMERKIAQTFFGELPKATNEDGLDAFQKADALKHEWKMNHLWMAKAYIALKKYDEVIKWIDSGLTYPIESEEDGLAQVELEALEKSYSKYRK